VVVQFSYPLEPDQIVMPGPIDPPAVIPRSRMIQKPDDAGSENVRWGSYNNTSFVHMFVHSGTHMDVNFHIDPNGYRLSAFEIADFVSERPLLLEIPKGDMERIRQEELAPYAEELAKSDFLFVYTGYSKYRKTDPDRYLNKQPGFSVAAAEYCVDLMGIENIGEAKTLEPQFPVHKAFLRAGRKFYLVEDANVGALLGKELVRSYAVPLLIPDAEGMLVTGFADARGRE